MRDKDICRCVCARHQCSGETNTTGIQGSYTVQRLKSPLHDDKRATVPRQQGNLRLTHFQCSQWTWTSNHRNVTSSHAADSVTFAGRVGNSKSRPRSTLHRNCERCSQTQKRVAPSSTGCQNIGDTIVRTSRFTLLKIFLAHNSFHQLPIRS